MYMSIYKLNIYIFTYLYLYNVFVKERKKKKIENQFKHKRDNRGIDFFVFFVDVPL